MSREPTPESQPVIQEYNRPTPSGELHDLIGHQLPAPAPAPALGPLHAIDKAIGVVEQVLLIMLLASMMLLGTAQVVLREVFNSGITWADPVLRNMVLWAGMVGAMVATQAGRHLNMDAFARLMRPEARRWVDVLVNTFAAGLCAYCVWAAIPYLKDEMLNTEPIAGGILHWHVQLIFPLAFGVMAYRFGLFAIDGALGGKVHEPGIKVL